MTNNLYEFKKRVSEDYTNGPVKTFSQEEIDEWTTTRYDEIYAKAMRQAGLSENDIKYLDSMKLMQAELAYSEIMEGASDGGGTDG
jgi:hypothetical protein